MATTKPEPASQTGSATQGPPDAAALQEATKLVNEVYAIEIAEAISPGQKSELSKKLLQAAIDTKSDPAGRYVLLTTASDMAGQAGDAETAFAVFDAFVLSFQADCLNPKIDALIRVAQISGANNHALLKGANRLIDEAVVADRYDVARTLAQQAVAFAKKTKDFDTIRAANARPAEIDNLKTAHEQVKKALETLAEKPKDAAANLVAGKFYCLTKGNWEKGLPMLASCSDPNLKALAEKELLAPANPAKQAEIGDGWWELGQKAETVSRCALRVHAAEWYKKALPGLTGLQKTRAEKRIMETPLSGEADVPGRRVMARISAVSDDEFSLYKNGKKILEGGGPKTSYVNQELAEGDIITVKAVNVLRGSPCGFSCVIAFGNGKYVITRRDGSWRKYKPASDEKWFDIQGMTEVGTPYIGNTPWIVNSPIAAVRIWGDGDTCYLVLRIPLLEGGKAATSEGGKPHSIWKRPEGQQEWFIFYRDGTFRQLNRDYSPFPKPWDCGTWRRNEKGDFVLTSSGGELYELMANTVTQVNSSPPRELLKE